MYLPKGTLKPNTVPTVKGGNDQEESDSTLENAETEVSDDPDNVPLDKWFEARAVTAIKAVSKNQVTYFFPSEFPQKIK